MGDEPLGSVFDPFPLDRNDVVTTRDSSHLIAVTSRHAFVRIPRTPAPRPRAGVVAATRIGDGLVVVTSRHALGALGPQFRSTRSEEHTSELQSHSDLVCRLLLEKKKANTTHPHPNAQLPP